ncbi:MAG TPA: epimerase, partial [Streptosporangiales bacterium]
GDRSDRFGYWPARFALAAERGDGPVLVPDAATQSTQTIDVRDLARWLVDSGRRRTAGTFNVVGERTPLGDVLDLAREAAGYRGEIVTADPAWLQEQGVGYWMGENSLPLWLPGADYAGHSARSDAAAVAAGLVRRPLAGTVVDSLAWERELGLDRDRRAGLGRDRELALVDMRAA